MYNVTFKRVCTTVVAVQKQ